MENLIGKKVFITSTCGGFINRKHFEEEGFSFEGSIQKIVEDKVLNPYQISFNNGISLINLKREDFVLIEDNIGYIKENIRFLIENKNRDLIILLSKNLLGEPKIIFENNNEINRKLNKDKFFLTEEEAKEFLKSFNKSDLLDLIRIESYYIN